MIKYEELKKMLQKNRSIPYPKIPKLYKNPKYCRMIYDSLGGKSGELTAITQYIYEHMKIDKEPDINKILKDIAIEEMHHLDILGEIVINLGENPIYKGSDDKLWVASNVKYDICELKEFMKLNVKAEEEAILGYMTILKYTNNIYLRKVYERILIDERTHLEIFRKVLADLN